MALETVNLLMYPRKGFVVTAVNGDIWKTTNVRGGERRCRYQVLSSQQGTCE